MTLDELTNGGGSILRTLFIAGIIGGMGWGAVTLIDNDRRIERLTAESATCSRRIDELRQVDAELNHRLDFIDVNGTRAIQIVTEDLKNVTKQIELLSTAIQNHVQPRK